MNDIFMVLLLTLLIGNAIAVVMTKNLLSMIIIFMAQSLVMVMIWILLESPDLAITEAAVGLGISSLLMFITLKKIHAIDAEKEQKSREK